VTFRKLIWFLSRPPLYREMLRRLSADIRRTQADREKVRIEREQAGSWCVANTDTFEQWCAATRLGGKPVSFSESHAAEWGAALAKANSCPVRMGGSGHLDLLYHACLQVKPEKVIETGVSLGWSTLAILTALSEQGKGHLTSIDMPYPGRRGDRFVGWVVPDSLRTRWTLLRGADRDVLPGLVAQLGGLDLVHYDSDKSPEGRTFAFELLWPALRPGGLLISDDVQQNFGFQEFARRVSHRPWILRKPNGSFAGVLMKPPPARERE
jgi:predicted O-methyltransferase YrrM